MITQSFVIPIIKVTDSCNFDCDFCYYSQKKLASKLMDINLCKEIIQQTYEYNLMHHNKNMRVIFHGGEPLLQSIDFYESIFDFEKSVNKGNQINIFHSIQTNGYNIDQEWIKLFKRNNVDVGISIDGPTWLNYHYNNSKGVECCTEKVLENIKKLSESSVQFGVISVITNRHLEYPKEMYCFCKNNNIHDLSLNFCYNPESNDSVNVEKLKFFLSDLFDMYFDGEYSLNIREFNEMIAKISGYCGDTCATCNRENCGQYMAFDFEGNVFFCDTAYEKTSALGNLRNSSLIEIINSTKYLSELIKSRNVFESKCNYCDVKDICGSGCYRYDDNGTNYFCQVYKFLSKYILNKLKNI